MQYLSSLLPVLALAATIDARVVDQSVTRRQNAGAAAMAAPMAPAAGAAACPCSCDQAGAMNMSAAGGAGAGGGGAGAGAGAGAGTGVGAKAIYFMSNQDENSIIMLPVQADGTLGEGSTIATGGKGGSLIDAMTNEPAQTDVLASQGAVRVLGDNLFAVNAGSNSLSMFAIDPQDPTNLAPVGQPAETGGDVRWKPPPLAPPISPCCSLLSTNTTSPQ
jgi:hypothetical protein